MESSFNAEYDVMTARLQPFSSRLERLVQDLLAAEHIRIHSVACRIKSRKSCLRKLEKSDEKRLLSSLTDVLGLRVITYFRDHVDAVAKVIEREFAIDVGNSVNKNDALSPDQFGYLSLHYVAQIGDSRSQLPEYRDHSEVKFEIQIRSILQHAWAEIEHDLGYKSEAAVPKQVRRRFSRLAGLLELADDEFVGIRDELEEHRAESTKTINRGDLDIEIDQDSLYSFVESDMHVRQMDIAILAKMMRPFSDEIIRSMMGARAERLTSVGFTSLAEVNEFLRSEEDLILACVEEWLKTVKSGSTDIPTTRGVSLVFAYVAKRGLDVLRSNRDGKDAAATATDDGYKTLVSRAIQKIDRPISDT